MSRRAQCPVCRDSLTQLPDGTCRRCAGRRLVADFLAAAALLTIVPKGSLPERVAAVADLVRDALLAEALAATIPPGSRRDAAAALDVAEGLITTAVRRYPWLGRAYKVARGRKPAQKATDP